MIDIIQRLRAFPRWHICSEAADEIDRLRGDLSESRIAVANLEMRLRHRTTELAEARELLRDAQTYAIDIQDFVLESEYKTMAVKCADRIDAFLAT